MNDIKLFCIIDSLAYIVYTVIVVKLNYKYIGVIHGHMKVILFIFQITLLLIPISNLLFVIFMNDKPFLLQNKGFNYNLLNMFWLSYGISDAIMLLVIIMSYTLFMMLKRAEI